MIRLRRTLLLSLLALGSLTAATASAQAAPSGDAPHGARQHRAHDPHKQAMHLGKKLGLSSDQTARLEPILAQRRDQVMAIRQNTALSPEEKRAQVRALKHSTRQQVSGVLTPDQMAQWKSMHHKHKGQQQAAPTGA